MWQCPFKSLKVWNSRTAYYNLSHKTVSTRENFRSECLLFCDQSDARWNRKRYLPNRRRDKSRLDLKQRAGPFFYFYEKSTIFPCISLLKLFLPHTNTSHLNPSVQKPNFRIDRVNCKNLQWYRFASWVKVSQLQKNTDRKPPIIAK